MWTTIIMGCVMINCFIAGCAWEDNNHESPRLRLFLTLLYLVAGVPIFAVYHTLNITRPVRVWIEARTNLWFFITFPFVKKKYTGRGEEYYEQIEDLYKNSKVKADLFHRLTTCACKKILILNNRKLQ